MNLFQFLIGFLGQVGLFSWALLIGVLVWTSRKLKSMRGRVITATIILGLFAAFPGRLAWESQKRVERYTIAKTMFQERCKKSGEFIHRTVEDVEGVLLMKIRTQDHMGDQYALDDQYGHDSAGEDYLKSFFLEPMLLANSNASTEVLESIRRDYRGYRYVEVLDPKDGQRYRYTGRTDEPWKTNPHFLEGHRIFVLDKTLAPDPAPRYGVTYDDISTPEERDHWIAGSSLKVIDLKTKEVIAERIGYMWDPGQGANGGGRTPWLMAADYACPGFESSGGQVGQTRHFVKRTLKPTQEH